MKIKTYSKESSVNIRRAQISDFPRIAAVQTESWRDTYADILPADYLQNQIAVDLERHWNTVEIQPGDVVLVAEDGGIIGFIAVWCRPEPFIDNLHVRPSRRSAGAGAQLIRAAARQLTSPGFKKVYLWVVADNQRAIRFYERLGAVCTERAPKSLFVHEALHVKMEWSDISILCSQ